MNDADPYATPESSTEAAAELQGFKISMRHQVLMFLCLVAAIAYIQRAAISVPALEIAADLNVNAAQMASTMGAVQSAWYLGYALLQIPSGWMADRFGSRKTLAVLCLLWSALTLVTGLSVDITSLTIIWFLMGAAQAGAFPCAAKAIGQIFPESERARASGILAAGMAVGGAIAPTVAAETLRLLGLAAVSIDIFRWRLLLCLLAIPGFLWTVVFLISIRPHALPLVAGSAVRIEDTGGQMWRRILTSRSLALLCAQQFFRAAAMVFFLTWFPTFLQKTRGVSLTQSGILTTIAGVGGVIGSVAGGVVSDWLFARTGNKRLSRQGIAVAGMGCCALLITASAAVADTNMSIAIISLGAFCATFGGVSGYTVAIEFGGKQAGTVFSTMNMCGNIGAMLFPITAGWMVDQTGNWNLILYFFAAIMAVDAVCWAILNPKEPLFV
jgi:MFS family permease